MKSKGAVQSPPPRIPVGTLPGGKTCAARRGLGSIQLGDDLDTAVNAQGAAVEGQVVVWAWPHFMSV